MSVRTLCRDLLARSPLADGLFRRLVWSRVHFPEVEMRFLNSLSSNSIDIAIDVGAAMGSYSWILNRKSRQVISFEPGELHARNLELTVFGTRITVVKAAVGAVCGKVAMYTPGVDTNALHSATLSRSNPVAAVPGTQVREVEQVTLDDFLARRIDAARTVDVLKVDVEGYELEVFKGATTLLQRYHPLIFCEIEQRHNAGYADVFRLLRAAGYSSYVFQEGRFVLFAGEAIDALQSAHALQVRLDRSYDPARNLYVNNFVFQHPESRIKVAK
jgi:FkbM family methyltransferase